MSLPHFSVKQPVLVNLSVALLIIGGLFSYSRMPKDQFPAVSIESIMVTTVLPGASPKEMEQLVTIPLEEEIAKVDEIKEMTSVSGDGISTIVLEMEPGIDNMFEKVTEIQNQIAIVKDFPNEAEKPVVREMKVSFETITVSIVGQAPERELKEFVEDLEAELKLLPGVEEIDIAGLRQREIWVECDPARLHSYGLSLADVARVLRQRNLNLPGGAIRMGRGEFSVRTEAEFRTLEDILETVIIQDGEHGYVRVRDVATVADTFEDRRSLARLDGAPSVNMIIRKDKKSDAIKLVGRIREVVRRFEDRLPAGLSLRFVNDASREVRGRLKALYQNLGLGLALCLATLWLFIGLRAGLFVAVGLPVALLTTFIFINAYGYSINMLVLFGLILVLGLLVDDAIVVCENIYRHVESGMPLREAAVRGAEEVTWPVVATVLTTVAAFLPLLLMTGVLGKFMSVIPVVVSLALMASLMECLIVLPSHVAEWGGGGDVEEPPRHQPRAWVGLLTRLYSRTIAFLMRWRYPVVALTVLTAVFTLYLAYMRMDFILFGGRDLEAFSLELETPPGSSLEETTRVLTELEAAALVVRPQAPEIETMRSRVGSINRSSFSSAAGTNFGQITFQLLPLTERERLGQVVKDQIRDAVRHVAGARTMTFEDARRGPPVGKPIQARIKGDNFDTLKAIAGEVKDFLKATPGVKDAMDNFPPGKDEVRPILDLEKVAALNLDVRTIATEIRGAFDGLEATKIHDGNEEIDVMVKYDAAHRRSLTNLSEMHFATPAGMIPFANIGRMERREGYAAISHHEQRRAINVLADVVEGQTTSLAVNRLLAERFGDLPQRYPGYSIDLGGEFEDTRESLISMLQAFIITIVLIYVILGGLFQSFVQPFIVMFSIPFAFIGVIVGFFLMNEPLGMFSIIGVIALCGIVVNDSLILIDFVNARRRLGLGRVDSVVHAGVTRLRPILLTSLTTLAGLSPMVFGLFGVDQFLRPMAMAIAWGLGFSTILTLCIIPCVYGIFDDFAIWLAGHPLGLTRRQWRQMRAEADRPEVAPPAGPLKPSPAEG